MTKGQKRIFFFLAIFGIILVAFVFRAKIFRGTLILTAQAPYNVEIVDEKLK